MQNHVSMLFERSASSYASAADSLSESIVTAAEWMTSSLLSEQKLMSCGAGASNSLSQYFCYTLLNNLERERPALPAINLSNESALSGISEKADSNELYSSQIQALGQAGDTLLVIANSEQTIALHQAIHTAEQRGMKTILLNCNQEPWWDIAPDSNRLEIFMQTESPAVTQQLHLTAIQVLCELIEIQLFGE